MKKFFKGVLIIGLIYLFVSFLYVIFQSEKPPEKEFIAEDYIEEFDYESLARTPDEFKGNKIKFIGEIIQVAESGKRSALRVMINNDYDEIVFCNYNTDNLSFHLLEHDTVIIYGTYTGLYTYTSIFKQKITIPGFNVDSIELVHLS